MTRQCPPDPDPDPDPDRGRSSRSSEGRPERAHVRYGKSPRRDF